MDLEWTTDTLTSLDVIVAHLKAKGLLPARGRSMSTNWRRRLVRVWAVVSVIYAALVVVVVLSASDFNPQISPMGWAVRLVASVGLVLAFWWAALYTCFWMAGGFRRDTER